MPGETIEKGDQVSWNWGGGAPGGEVAETKDEGEIAIKSKRGNTIKKNASPDNPAVHIARSGNDVVKRASELDVKSKASETKGGKSSKSPAPAKENGTKKREHEKEEAAEGDEKEKKKATEPEPKKAKSSAKTEDAKKGRGRPKKGSDGGTGKREKVQKPRSTEGIGSRTRSRA